MKVLMWQKYQRSSRALLAVALVAGLALIGSIVRQASAGIPLSVAGFQGFSYATPDGVGPGEPFVKEVTGTKPESKLWWNDGFWWASMYNRTADEFHIYRLNWGTQDWEDTGVVLDTRRDSQADVLWDEGAGKLYVVSHVRSDNSSQVNSSANWGHFFRYSYDEATQTYTPDLVFPIAVNQDKTESLVIDKDSTGRLWVTYVSRPQGTSNYQVYANVSTDDGDTWGTPFVIPVAGAQVASDDLSSLIAFEDSGSGFIGVMWSNQSSSPATFNFAVHSDGSAPTTGWAAHSLTPTGGADDHINIKSLTATDEGVFAAVKTSASADNPFDPEIGVVAFDTSTNQLSFHEYSNKAENDTQPMLLIDEENDELYVFVTGKPTGSKICYKTLEIVSPLNTMGNFPAGDCGTPFIEDLQISSINHATSTKQNVNSTTGIVVLASDDINGNVYVYNLMGDPPPVVSNRSPGFGATNVLLDTTITATFSKQMNGATINDSSFVVKVGGSPIAGDVDYDAANRRATFTPAAQLSSNTTYTVELTDAIEDDSGQSLYGTGTIRETWSFSTGTTVTQPAVSFNQASYTVSENAGTATITVQLNPTSSGTVTVAYTTEDLSALAGHDYTATSGTLTFAPGETTKTFTVPILDDLLDEANKAFKVKLLNPTNAVLGDPQEATVQITDNDPTPTVQFSAANYNITEAAGTATITVNLSAPSGLAVSVDYATSNGTATAPGDYTPAAGTLEFAPGETSKTFTVTVKNDGVSGESDEIVNLTLSNPVNATLGTPSTATLTIVGSIKVYLPVVIRQ
ncbi:MAG TPA: Calx-beta domain-containing protein [Anaerolineae bacterium]